MSRARKAVDRNKDPDPDLAAELRSTAGREWAEEAAEDERLTELQRRRRQPLSDVMKELAARRERVSAEFGGHNFSGSLIAAGDDFVTVEGTGQVADIRLEGAVWSTLPGDAQPSDLVSRELTFRGLIHEYAASETRIRIALPAGGFATGAVTVVATDHLEMVDVDQRRLLLPMDTVLAVIRWTGDH